jgi:MATE family multidrug resistance protein
MSVTEPTAQILPRPRDRAKAHGAAPWLAEARALILLAAPLALTQLAQMAVLTTDVIMLGRLGKTALASAAIGNTIYYLAWLIGYGPASAVSPMIAHIVGEGRFVRARVRRAVRMGLWSTAILAAPMIGLMLLARPILIILRQDPVLADGAGVFVGWLSLGLVFTIGYQVLRNFCTALGHAKAPLIVMGATIAYNALADYALIFGHFGFPRLGLAGSGMATSSSALFAFLAMLVVVGANPALRQYRIPRRLWRPALGRLAEVFRLGMPMGLAMIFEAMLFNSMTLVMGTFGPGPLAAHQIALNFASITFMVPLGVAMAATVRVGLAAGQRDLVAARRAGFTAMALGAACMVVSGLIMVTAGRQIAGLYFGGHSAADQDVFALAGAYLKIAAAFQVFDALQAVGGLSLRGLKDAHMPMVLAGAAYWLVGAPTCLILAIGLRMRGQGVWIGLAVGLGAAALLMIGRFERMTRRPAI